MFAAEQALGLPSGSLAGLLDFGPPSKTPPSTPRQPDVVDAILADDCLDDEQRQLLLSLYRQLHARRRRR